MKKAKAVKYCFTSPSMGIKNPHTQGCPGYRGYHLGAALPQSVVLPKQYPAETFPLVVILKI